jgi:hypothetical protein
MRFFMLFAALLAGSLVPAPSVAVQPAPAAYAREFQAIGAWMLRLESAVAPIGEAVGAMSGWWDSAESAGDVERGVGRIRAGLAEALAKIDAVDASLAALDRPEFPALPLTPDMRPARIVSDMGTINGHVRTLLQRYATMLEAMLRDDRRAVQAAGTETIAGLRLINSTQVLLRRAALAATPRDESSWEMLNVQLLLFRVPERLLVSWEQTGGSGRDERLQADLGRFADELDATAEAGSAKLEREIAQLAASLSAAERRGVRARIATERASLEVRIVDRAVFQIAREMAAGLRGDAAQFADGNVTVARLGGVVRRLHPFRDRLQDVVRQENAIAAGVR